MLKFDFQEKDLNQLDLVNKMSLILGGKGHKVRYVSNNGCKKKPILFCLDVRWAII
jgi:hypothetical protein